MRAVVFLGVFVVPIASLSAQVSEEPPPSIGSAETPVVIRAEQYPSLQAAVDAVPEAGGLVTIPPGHFKLEQPLRITTGDTLIRGSGPSTHLENVNRDGRPAVVIAHDDHDGTKTPSGRQLWRVQLSDFRVTGNEASGSGIVAHQINEIFVQGVTVSYHGGHGIELDECYEDPRISNSLITYNAADGVHLRGAHDIVVSANQFEENRTGLRCLDSFNLTMTGNNLDDHLGDGVIIENTYGSVLSGNMIEECQGWGIILDRDCYGITISANVIAHEFTGGIDLRDAHGCAVTGNTFTIVKNVGLRIAEGSGRIAVTGNSFGDSYIGGVNKRDRVSTTREAAPDAAGGLVLETDEAVVVVGNVFSGLDDVAITGRAVVPEAQLRTNTEVSTESSP